MSTTPVQNNELLAKYVTNKQEIMLNGTYVKGDMFVPTNLRKTDPLEVSVVRFGDRTIDQMQTAGKAWGHKFGKTYIGLVKVLTENVRKVEDLDVNPSPRPKWELLHSDIINWYLEEPRHRIQAELVARQTRFFRA